MAVRLGRDRLHDADELFSGRRVGLVTNHTGRSTIEFLRARGVLVALFSPEHGIRGRAGAGERVPSSFDEESGVPVHSLYGETRRPTPAMLAGVDLLMYDIQDVGARCFTYIATLLEVLRAAAEARIPVAVLDRPVPTGGVHLDGPVLDPAYRSFVGPAPIPLRYAMTCGELAAYYVGALGVRAELRIVDAVGWRREMWWDETGLPWLAPSPALQTLDACALYPGTVLFEATNVSEGRATPEPFAWIGAPWLDAEGLARGVLDPAVRLHAESRGPGAGVRLEILDRDRLRPVALAIRLLAAIRDRHSEALNIDAARFDRLAGTDSLRRALERGDEAEKIVTSWEDALAAFARERDGYLRY